eukprot:scaffold72250_cov17-Tisochrysis_lutea.AAC.1
MVSLNGTSAVSGISPDRPLTRHIFPCGLTDPKRSTGAAGGGAGVAAARHQQEHQDWKPDLCQGQ